MKPVTGPDGDNPITTEELERARAVWRSAADADVVHAAWLVIGAFGAVGGMGERDRAALENARTRLAAVWNDRHTRETA